MKIAPRHFRKKTGPLGTVYSCAYCKHGEIVRKGYGRGHGLREGNKAQGRLWQHLKDCHANELEDEEPAQKAA